LSEIAFDQHDFKGFGISKTRIFHKNLKMVNWTERIYQHICSANLEGVIEDLTHLEDEDLLEKSFVPPDMNHKMRVMKTRGFAIEESYEWWDEEDDPHGCRPYQMSCTPITNSRETVHYGPKLVVPDYLTLALMKPESTDIIRHILQRNLPLSDLAVQLICSSGRDIMFDLCWKKLKMVDPQRTFRTPKPGRGKVPIANMILDNIHPIKPCSRTLRQSEITKLASLFRKGHRLVPYRQSPYDPMTIHIFKIARLRPSTCDKLQELLIDHTLDIGKPYQAFTCAESTTLLDAYFTCKKPLLCHYLIDNEKCLPSTETTNRACERALWGGYQDIEIFMKFLQMNAPVWTCCKWIPYAATLYHTDDEKEKINEYKGCRMNGMPSDQLQALFPTHEEMFQSGIPRSTLLHIKNDDSVPSTADLPLTFLARIAIRKSLPQMVFPSEMAQNIDCLSVPKLIKDFLFMGGSFTEKVVMKSIK
jgi:hypothetical protein